ncbi:protein FAM71C-like [Myotis myotis]|nr:protein FAM71C-like [Myotis myotis]
MDLGSNMMLWQGSHVLPMFRGSVGKLQRQLCKGEFAMFKDILMFESDFIQINKRGEVIGMHNNAGMVTVGIAYTSPDLTIPDVMLLARPAVSCVDCTGHDPRTRCLRGKGLKPAKILELTRLLPLRLVKLSIHSHENKQLHLKLASGSSFYLQLYSPSNAKEDLFAHWEDLVFFLRPPVEAYSGTQAVPACDMMDILMLEAEDRKSPAAMEFHREGAQDQVSIRSLHMVTELSGATSLAYAGGEGVQQYSSWDNLVLKDTLSFLTPAPAGPDQAAVPEAAALTPEGSVSSVVGGETTNRPGTETLEGPGAGPFISACQSKDNEDQSEENGDQKVSQCQAEALRKENEKEKTHTKKPSHSGREWEDKSIPRSHGTTQGDQKKKDQSSPGGKVHGSSPQEYNSLSVTQKRSRSSQKSKRR